MKKVDKIVSLILGFLIGLFLFLILTTVRKELPFQIPYPWSLPIVFAFLGLIWIYLISFLGKKYKIILQGGRFVLVGTFNTFVDWGVLSLLMGLSGIYAGWGYSIFKGISFTVAVVNSYFWNKFWTFGKRETKEAGKEFAQFFLVSIVGFLINVGMASLVVNVVGVQFGWSEKIWALFGAFLATLTAMTWNFLGYKFFVFKK